MHNINLFWERVKKNPWYFLIGAVAAVILTVRIISVAGIETKEYLFDSIQLHFNSEEQIYTSNPASLEEGIYQITVNYDSSDGGLTNVYCDTHSHKTLICDNPSLSQYENSKSFDIWLNDDVSQLMVEVKADGGTINVSSISVKTQWNSKLYLITCCILRFFAVIGILCAVKNRDKFRKHSKTVFSIAVITLFSSLGVFLRYLLPGHDQVFHLLRIEGLKDAMLMGDIPTRVQTNWLYGYGYSVSAMYCDTMLIIPALMRIIGFTLQTTLKTYVFLINLGTAVCTYLCFRKMTKTELSAIIGTFLYVCAPYRLICIYNREALGEYTGMLFLPLIALGFYYAYKEDDGSENYGKKIIAPVIGFSGLIQTHILSCLMVALFGMAFVLIKWRSTFRKNRLIYLGKIAGFTILINLWFIIPFLRFMKEPLNVTKAEDMVADIQSYGLSIPELVSQNSSGHFWYNFAFYTSLSQRNTMSPGNGIIVLLLLFVLLLCLKRLGKKTGTISLMAFFTVAALWLSSNLFPYSALNKIWPWAAVMLTKVQFPYRYLTMAILFGSIFAMLFYDKFVKKYKKNLVIVLTCFVLLIASSQSLNHMYALFYGGYCTSHYDAASLDSAEIIGAQYLYDGTDLRACERERDVIPSNVDIERYLRWRNQFDITCKATGDAPGLVIPVFAYPGYEAYTEDGTRLETVRGYNNTLTVSLPMNYSGTISVRYKEPLLWRISEIISLIGFVYLIYYGRNSRRESADELV